MAKIAFIGLGNMGSGMCANLCKAGMEVSVYDLSPAARDAAADAGARVADSAEAAAQGAEMVITMRAAGSHVLDVYFDTGRPQQAVTYAERAVRTSPSASRYRLKLGDALFKVLRYQEALSEYREANKLGSKRAASRIEKVNAKLGR